MKYQAILLMSFLSVADLGGREGRSFPLQILSISCSFWENLAKSYVDAPLEGWRPTLGKSWIRHCLYICMYILNKNAFQ